MINDIITLPGKISAELIANLVLEEQFFICQYGHTTYNEAMEALNSGKILLATGRYDTTKYYICHTAGINYIAFGSAYYGTGISSVILNKNNTWLEGNLSIRQDFTTTNNNTFPTTLAVSDFVDGELSDVEDVLDEILGNGNINYELTSNKTTSISSSSTDIQYPSAKCVYDLVGNIETLLAAI